MGPLHDLRVEYGFPILVGLYIGVFFLLRYLLKNPS